MCACGFMLVNCVFQSIRFLLDPLVGRPPFLFLFVDPMLETVGIRCTDKALWVLVPLHRTLSLEILEQ